MRDEGWDSLLKDVTNFCEQHEILVPNMNDNFFVNGKSRRMTPHVTMWHHYHANLFVSVIDMLLQELNNRFNETNLELLHSIACFSPLDSFHAFDLDNDLIELKHQLKVYIVDMRNDDRFALVLPVATAYSGESFSALNTVKTKLRKKMGDQWMNDCLVTFIEKDLFSSISNVLITRQFQDMKTCRNRL
ncbi:uncharacterized protein LOC130803796 [Amaranthus tricolor]|uniref:uncharacterized protein LOC130803796 n=1 Tax=Amaranthus tricolor TaxID=29722 RepID=UPI00258B8433|nr:uncharacterized protein LOC130803796 [Amaranthus tricolor]